MGFSGLKQSSVRGWGNYGHFQGNLYLSVFSPSAGECGPEKLEIRALSTDTLNLFLGLFFVKINEPLLSYVIDCHRNWQTLVKTEMLFSLFQLWVRGACLWAVSKVESLAREPRLPWFILLVSFSDTLLVTLYLWFRF